MSINIIFEEKKWRVSPTLQYLCFRFYHSWLHTIAKPIQRMLWTPVDSMHLIQLNVFRSLAHAHKTSTIIRKIEKKRARGRRREREREWDRKQNTLFTLYSRYKRKYQKTSKYFASLNTFHDLFNLFVVHIANYDRIFMLLLLLLSPLFIPRILFILHRERN